MRAVVYTRVSSDPKGAGRSVAEQEKECRGVASAAGWEVVEVFTDNDRSASRYATKGRPAFRALTAAVEDGQCDVLITLEASRFQRDLEAYVKLRELCRRHGVQWSYSGRTFDLARTDDRLATGLDALLAERESDMTRDRVLRAVRSNAERGRPHGRLLYGYRRDYDAKTGALVAQIADEAQAAVVREAARRVVAGETPYAVAQDFNRRGIPTPRGGQKWDLIQVKRLCVNPGYVGKRVHQGRVVGDADWAPLLEESVHYQLVARLGDPKRRTQRSSAVAHLLSGIALCGVCQSRVRLQKNRGRLSYMCGAGFHVSRGESDVDRCVEAVTVERLRRPDILELMTTGATDELDQAMAELAGLRARLDGFYDVAARGELTPAALARVEATLLPQITAAESRARRVVLSPVLADASGPDAATTWAELSVPQKREVVNALMTVSILPTRRGARSFDPESVRIEWKTS
jgi:site-specific DNA recombinase